MGYGQIYEDGTTARHFFLYRPFWIRSNDDRNFQPRQKKTILLRNTTITCNNIQRYELINSLPHKVPFEFVQPFVQYESPKIGFEKEFIDHYCLETIMVNLDAIFNDNIVSRTIIEMSWTLCCSEYGYAWTPEQQLFHLYTDEYDGTIVTGMVFPTKVQVYITRVKYMEERHLDRFYINGDTYFLRPELHGIATETMVIREISLDLIFLP